MLKRLATFFSPDGNAVTHADPETLLRLAAAALLVEAAIIDGQFHEKERAAITQVLSERFGLDDDETAELMGEAEIEVAESAQIFKFTRVIAETLEADERVAVIEMLWDVVFADGRVDDYEAALARRVAGLLHISDRDHANARRSARQRSLQASTGTVIE